MEKKLFLLIYICIKFTLLILLIVLCDQILSLEHQYKQGKILRLGFWIIPISQVGVTMRQRNKASISSPSTNAFGKQDLNSSNSDRIDEARDSGSFVSPRRVFALCLAFRLVNALLVQTYFNPDEHWQALEVAHRIAFGYF